ncbi:MAG TPA: sialate O-acetylesterase, partial [Bryobacteraceae bacterium]|nr:sialate O-acetylesterase [Bryobacteraceae bacterium]
FASGQSNMEMPLAGFPGAAIKNSAAEISQANQPAIRLLLVQKKASAYPVNDLDGPVSWSMCTPETAAKFSAVAYFFGRDLSSHEQVPIGLIDSSWGGTPAEAWTSLPGIAADASLMPVFSAWASMTAQEADMTAIREAEKRADAEARSKNQPLPKHAWRPEFASWDPAWLFNGMVAPFLNLPIKGVIWYQGESNAPPERAFLYQKLFAALISDWHVQWQDSDFPFLFVQLANYNASPSDDWPAIREAQRRALSLKNTGMAVAADIGDPENIHPADKQDVGLRLALAARAIAYHENIEYSGPVFRSISSEGSNLRIWFDHAGAGLEVKNGALSDFQIAGDDRKFVDAAATVDGSTVVVNSPRVTTPKYVRYGWQNNPSLHLYNSANLPASPFTSESAN